MFVWAPEKRHGSTAVEYQAMPFLLDVQLHYNIICKFHRLAAGGQLLSGQPVRYGKARRYGPSITYKIIPARGILLPPAGRAAVLGQPSSLRPHWVTL